MAFYQPTRQRQELNPQLLILIAAIFLFLISFFVVAAMEQKRPEQRILPDWAIAATPLQASDFAKLEGKLAYTRPSITATVKTSPLEVALSDLLKGPSAAEMRAGQYSEVPKGTQLLGVSVNHNVVMVDLSEEFVSGGGSTSMLGRVEELRETVTGINKNYKLKIAINGQPVKYLGGEGLELE